MTDKDILQSRIDHAHLRADIEQLVKAGTPTRLSRPHLGMIRGGLTWRSATLVQDYANGAFRIVD